MDSRKAQVVHQLFLLNITLQLFDGAATYFGVRHPWYEANPLIATFMTQMGIGAALLLFKGGACAALLLLRSLGTRPLAMHALATVAAVYGALSFVPWTAKNLTLL
jgi:hypothetical protein